MLGVVDTCCVRLHGLLRKSEIHSKNIYLFTRSIIIRGKYSFTELSSFQETYQFIQGDISSFKENIFIKKIISIQGNIFIKEDIFVKVQGHMFIQGNYIH